MNDLELQHAVAEELEWAPHVDAARIQIAVQDGVVHLQGDVGTLAEKKAASRAVWHLRGVTGVRDEIVVRPPASHAQPDEELSQRARQLLLWDAMIPSGQIDARAIGGVIVLTGRVDQAYQKAEAEQLVSYLAGVVGVDNAVVVQPPAVTADELREWVIRALVRHHEFDASGVVVAARGDHVTLSGTVSSYTQRRIAENAAWAVRGVANVIDRLRVRR